MKRLKAIGAFWYDFVVGDDWRVATVVVVALALTALLVHAAGVNAWWLLPVCVFAALGWSLRRATAQARPLRPAAARRPAPSTGPTSASRQDPGVEPGLGDARLHPVGARARPVRDQFAQGVVGEVRRRAVIARDAAG